MSRVEALAGASRPSESPVPQLGMASVSFGYHLLSVTLYFIEAISSSKSVVRVHLLASASAL